ncbi:MAG: cysteine desulfurase [Candidatus Acidulodesulfobacterium acidiphilum]|uniref:Cysteine desulfurase n=1 Tax=Candidatus Acidulodesulfobacterium acidiphilum TaxID=2597224 RepID=A0A520XF11_9DELT|nr:MAG: cysteine desulfurase [Candidatus Acidulodesulfobacterium acidiphilum]
MPRIYLDYNATTPVDTAVLEEVVNTLKNYQGNPSSVYEEGRAARILIEDSRDLVKSFLDAGNSGEVIFTSSGSESINLAITGSVYAYMKNNKKKVPHIITSTVEHHAVLNTFKFLESIGIETTYVGVNEFGMIDIEEITGAIRENTSLVSIMGANNETGTLFPIKQIFEEVKKIKEDVICHSDLVQVIGKAHFSLKDVPLDMCSFSGHKFYALKGCGALYVKKGVNIEPIIHGGHQERGLRAGTENIAGIVSIAKGMSILKNIMNEEAARINSLGSIFHDKLFYGIEGIKLNGNPVNRLKNTLNVSFDGVKSETLLFNLDLYGISASAGSACNAGTVSLSHVLKAHGYDAKRIESAIRFSIGRYTTEDDIDYAVSAIKKGVLKLRTGS